jgi:hypothetical protein
MSFRSKYCPDIQKNIPQGDTSPISHLEAVAPGISSFLGQYGGVSFNQGLYRVHPVSAMPLWTTTVAKAFPDYSNRIFCFSYDWLGRHFAIDSHRQENGQCHILMLEPGTGQTLEIPAGFRGFHDTELVEHQNEALAANFYREWLAANGAVPSPSECIGYKKPLFLGGKDAVENLELIDLDVYWTISGQLLLKIRDLPVGTKIGTVSIEDNKGFGRR